MRNTLITVLLIALSLTFITARPARAAEPAEFEGKTSNWNGYTMYQFQCDDRDAIVVAPKQVAPGKPWIWRARFWGHRPEVDLALLAKGWHVVYIDVANLYGCEQAVEHWNAMYEELVDNHGFAKRPALEGMSRGGLIIFNWAIANLDKVACIYADAPVCDFKSWPGGYGKGKGSETDWKRLLLAYGFADEQEALKYPHNPVDSLAPLAAAGIPLIHVVGDADDVVPPAENTLLVEKRYKDMGGEITVIHKPGVGHKHGLDDPKPLIDFIVKYATPKAP
ncbi:MAG: prolyl oligopeptidase family serine peptidase [Phycisphaera sp.]|nr:prolyl oligopeptidase family serine peptidase [Phycisphaera sp.]